MTDTAKKKETSIRVLVVDDHPIVRQGLTQLMGQEDDMVVCGEAADYQEAIEQIEKLKPDLVTVDLSLADVSGMELIKEIRQKYPTMYVLVLSMHDELMYAERALRAGANGFITKQEAPDRVLQAVRKIAGGSMYLSDAMMTRMLGRFVNEKQPTGRPLVEELSDRELEVFQLIGRGMANREMAAKLGISVKTIESHRESIKSKLHLRSSAELVQYAVQWVDKNTG